MFMILVAVFLAIVVPTFHPRFIGCVLAVTLRLGWSQGYQSYEEIFWVGPVGYLYRIA